MSCLSGDLICYVTDQITAIIDPFRLTPLEKKE
jgi:hypothetical protein